MQDLVDHAQDAFMDSMKLNILIKCERRTSPPFSKLRKRSSEWVLTIDMIISDREKRALTNEQLTSVENKKYTMQL